MPLPGQKCCSSNFETTATHEGARSDDKQAPRCTRGVPLYITPLSLCIAQGHLTAMSLVSSAAHLNAPSLLDTTMEIHDDDYASYNSSSKSKAMATPSPRTDSENNQLDHEDEEDAEEEEEEDVFAFDAPAYYDLKNPALEAQYVNNADGYFTPEYKPRRKPSSSAFMPSSSNGSHSGSTRGASSAAPAVPQPPASDPAIMNTPHKAHSSQYDNTAQGLTTPASGRYQQRQRDSQQRAQAIASSTATQMTQYREPQKMDADVDDDEHMSDDDTEEALAIDTNEDMHIDELNSSTMQDTESPSTSRLYDDKEESFDEVFAQYASSSTSSRHSMAHLLQEPSSYDYSPHSSRDSSHAPQSSSSGARNQDESMERPPRSMGYVPSVSSKLLQPTQAFLRRIHTENAIREQSMMEGAPLEDKPFRLTKPKSPTLLTSQKAQQAYRDPTDPSRLSYTSRELLKIQEERLRIQMEKMKIREFHERTKAQRPPVNVHQRSTKQLTIPVSPYLEVGHRTRRINHSDSDASDGSNNNEQRDRPQTFIRPETLMSRDFSLPVTQQHVHHDSHGLTVRRMSGGVGLSLPV